MRATALEVVERTPAVDVLASLRKSAELEGRDGEAETRVVRHEALGEEHADEGVRTPAGVDGNTRVAGCPGRDGRSASLEYET